MVVELRNTKGRSFPYVGVYISEQSLHNRYSGLDEFSNVDIGHGPKGESPH